MSTSTNNNSASAPAPAPATAPTAANNTSATASATSNNIPRYDIHPDAAKLLDDKTKHLSNLALIYDDILGTVAMQKEDFMQRRLLQASINFLHTKLKIDKYAGCIKHLQEKDSPPSSVKMKVTLTLSKPEVVASEAFQALVTEFDCRKLSFQDTAKDLFIKTKNLELEATKKSITNIFFTSYLKFISTYTELQIADM